MTLQCVLHAATSLANLYFSQLFLKLIFNPRRMLQLQDTPDDTALHQSLKQDLDNALLTLNPRECGVLRLRYGLDDGEEKTLEEIGQKFSVRNISCIKIWMLYLCTFLYPLIVYLQVVTPRAPDPGNPRAHQAD